MKTFAQIYDSMKDTLAYQVEELSLAFTESVLLRMEELDNLQRKELAERMESSEAYVSKILKGKSNFTFETLVKLARALECRIEAPVLVPFHKTPSSRVISFIKYPEFPKLAFDSFRARTTTEQPTMEPQDDTCSNAAAA